METYFNQGYISQYVGDYENATKNILKAQDIFKVLDKKRAIQALNLLGIINVRLKNNEKAYEFSESAMKLAYKIGDSGGYYKTKKTLAIINKNLKKFDEALQFNKDVADFEARTKNYFSLGKTYNNIAIVYDKTKKYDSSLIYYKKALRLKEQYGSKRDIINSYHGFGNLYSKMNDISKSEFHILKARDLAKSSNFPYELMHILQSLADINYQQGKYKQAFDALEESKVISDSLRSVKMKTNIAELETKYQTQQKEHEILKLTNENIQKEASLTQSKYTIFAVLGALLLILGFGYFYWNKRKQQHQLALLEHSVKSSEAEKSRIGKELHDNIAGTLMTLVHESETAQMQLSHKLLQAYNEVRGLSHQLDNTPMHNELFLDRVLDIIPDRTETKEFSLEITPRHLQIKEPYGTHIFRIIQELIANNLKYAKATQTQIKIVSNDYSLILTYDDNGVGTTAFKKGNGYKNIEDRIALMDGSLDLQHQNGFSVTANIPYSV